VHRLALLANPDSGRGESTAAERLLHEQGATVRVFGLDGRSDLARWSADRIVVAGGDGSIGPAAESAAELAIPLAVLPTGTANDFARALDVPLDLEAACRLAVHGTWMRRLDLGRMDGRPFVNVASVGLSPVAAEQARGLKRMLGPLAYSVGALRAGLTAQPVRCTITCDGSPLFDGRAWQASVAVTGAFGGGSDLDADPEDGRLDVVVVSAGSRARLVARAYGMRSGRVESQAGVTVSRGERVELTTDGGTLFNVDGELVDANGARFSIRPRAFELVCE
jgi:YegS/Rv2252/BmrU family lipid kinase